MKICGCKESCFERGDLWGHLSGVLCKYLTEEDVTWGTRSFCSKFKRFVNSYSTKEEYKNVKMEKSDNE